MSTKILMPALSPTMEHGNLVKWHKKEGDLVKSGEILAEIETDKATMEVEAVDEGILLKILVEENTSNVAVNTPIALLIDEGENAETVLEAFFAETSLSMSSSETMLAATPQASPAVTEQDHKNILETGGESRTQENQENKSSDRSQAMEGRLFVSPLARRMAQERGINLTHIKGSGPLGRIVARDIEAGPVATMPAKPAASLSLDAGRDEPLSTMRQVIARRLTESKQTVPHFYLSIDLEIDELLAIRARLNESLKDHKVSVNDFVVRAVALALQEVPEANASFLGDKIRYYEHSDIAIAVAIEGGLITPIVRAAETKNLVTLSREIKELVGRARDGKLKPQEYQGGSFSISNLGMYGIREFAAIINPPQAAILAVGAGAQRPLVKKGQLQVATQMTVTLSVDHRVIDGKVGADFLNALRQYMENPLFMMAEG